MASKNFKATWMGQYRADNKSYVGGSSPIRTGGSPWYHSFIGFDKTAILNAMNSSKTTPRVYLHTYVTNAGNFVMGMHKETTNKAYSTGMPFYSYARVYKTYGTGWHSEDITDISLSGTSLSGFKNILNNGYTAPVWYGDPGADQGEAYGTTNNSYHIYIEVQGTWNTKPGTPTIAAPTSGTKVDGNFELKGNHASDSEQSSSQLRYEWAIHDGTGWDYLGFGSYGVVNKVVDFSKYAETTSARVCLRANDGSLTGDWVYSGYFTISHNKPPGAPSNLSPVGGAQIDRTKDTTFSWTHNDADGQSAYDFRWREQGTSTWNDSGKIVTTSKTRTVPGNTFPQATIEWQVRTYDQEGLVGPYSTSAIINATEPSDAPTITDPSSGESIPTARISLSWSAAEQEAYQVELVENGAVVWSQERNSTTRLISIDYDLQNNTEYTIRLRTRGQGELYSAWDSVNFSTSFTPPAQPLVELSEFENGSVHVQVENPLVGTEGEPTVIENEVYRRVFGTDDNYIRIADNVENNGVFIDYTPASGVTYEYVVRARGDNDTFTNSGAYTISIELEHSILALSSDPTRFVVLEFNPSRSINRGVERNLMQFNGRKFPVAEFGYNESKNTSLSFSIRNETDLDILIDLLESKETLLYRDVRGRRDFVTTDSLKIDDQMPTGYNVSFNIENVDYVEGVE